MTHRLDTVHRRRGTGSVKWDMYGEDVIPLWVADMDFPAPPAVIEALKARAEHGIFGYHFDSPELRAVLTERLRERHHMDVQPAHFVFLPGLVAGLNLICRLIGESDSGVLVMPPIYPPFLNAPVNNGRRLQTIPLVEHHQNGRLHYEIDFDGLEAAITPWTKLLLLCNPHNPTGRVFTRAELERLADICLRHDVMIASDEIHCDLVYDEYEHISIASLSPEVAARTITMLAPSKTFNVPGLGLGFAVIADDALRGQMMNLLFSSGAFPHIFGYTGALAAYRDGQPWLDEVMGYLKANRALVLDYVAEHLPGVTLTMPEGTYMTWLDFRALQLPQPPYKFFLEHARVALIDGSACGTGYESYARLNFASAQSTLLEGLDRMRAAVMTARSQQA